MSPNVIASAAWQSRSSIDQRCRQLTLDRYVPIIERPWRKKGPGTKWRAAPKSPGIFAFSCMRVLGANLSAVAWKNPVGLPVLPWLQTRAVLFWSWLPIWISWTLPCRTRRRSQATCTDPDRPGTDMQSLFDAIVDAALPWPATATRHCGCWWRLWAKTTNWGRDAAWGKWLHTHGASDTHVQRPVDMARQPGGCGTRPSKPVR